MNEFGLIARYLAPLTGDGKAALQLEDDAAVIPGREGYEWVITKDAMVAGVHFFADTSPALIARKLVRTNLSDMAAMGAKPCYYLLAGFLPKQTNETWWKGFSASLKEENSQFGVILLGGDTVAHNGALSLSLTMIGEVEKGEALLRSGAQHDDAVCVSGTLGDAALGLRILQGKIADIPLEYKDYLVDRYHSPQPRVTLSQAIQPYLHSAIDISDGFVADLGHICRTSSVGAMIEQADIPLSDATRYLVERDPSLWEVILTGGDDYELLCTLPKNQLSAARNGAESVGGRLTPIGSITAGEKVTIHDRQGKSLLLSHSGYNHF